MDYLLRITRAGQALIEFDDEGTYQLGEGFIPPDAQIETALASGTSANQWGGGTPAVRRAKNVELKLPVSIESTSAAGVEQAFDNLRRVLHEAGEGEPTYLEWRPIGSLPVPRWGQWNALRRWEIVSGRVSKPRGYGRYSRETRLNECPVVLSVKSIPFGARQRLGSARGGIRLATEGSPGNKPRGLIIAPAGRNLFANPIFSTSASSFTDQWDSTGAVEEMSFEHRQFGVPIPRLVGHDGSDRILGKDIELSDTKQYSIQALVRRPDGQPVTAEDAVLTYGFADLASSYIHLGNGWYRIAATFDGLGGPSQLGIIVRAHRSVFVAGMQLEESAYCTPFWYGEALGASWAGTPYQSTINREEGRLIYNGADLIVSAEGTLTIVWMPDRSSDADTGKRYLFSNSPDQFYMYYSGEDGKFYVGNWFNEIAVTQEQTFDAWKPIVFHVTWGSHLRLYINGAEAAAQEILAGIPVGNLFIGSDYFISKHASGVFLGLTTYDQEFTPDQVAADYANMLPLLERGERIDHLPFLWTKDGDNVVDNGFAGNLSHVAVAADVAGDVPALTELWCSAVVDDPGLRRVGKIYLGLFGAKAETGFPSNALFLDLAGTADANALGGQTKSWSMLETESSWLSVGQRQMLANLQDKEFYLLFRARAATGTSGKLSLWAALNVGNARYMSDKQIVSFNDTYQLVLLGRLQFLMDDRLFKLTSPMGVSFRIVKEGGSLDTLLDYIAVCSGPLVLLDAANASLMYKDFLLTERTACVLSSGNAFVEPLPLVGDQIEFAPDALNVLMVFLGDGDITYKLTYSKIYVTPRYLA